MGEVVKLDDARAAKQAKRRRRLALVAVLGLVALLVARGPVMADNANYTPSSSRYVLGYVAPGSVASFFKPQAQGTEDEIPNPATSSFGYLLTPVDSPALDQDLQYAVSRSGAVEKVYQVTDPSQLVTQEGGELAPKGLGLKTASQLAALGVDPATVDDRAPMTTYGYKAGQSFGYNVATVRRPANSNSFGDSIAGKVVGFALNAVGNAFTFGAFSAAQDLSGEHVGEANQPVGRPSPRLGYLMTPPTPGALTEATKRRAWRSGAGNSRYADAAAKPAANSSWLARHASDTPFLAWLQKKVSTHG